MGYITESYVEDLHDYISTLEDEVRTKENELDEALDYIDDVYVAFESGASIEDVRDEFEYIFNTFGRYTTEHLKELKDDARIKRLGYYKQFYME